MENQLIVQINLQVQEITFAPFTFQFQGCEIRTEIQNKVKKYLFEASQLKP